MTELGAVPATTAGVARLAVVDVDGGVGAHEIGLSVEAGRRRLVEHRADRRQRGVLAVADQRVDVLRAADEGHRTGDAGVGPHVHRGSAQAEVGEARPGRIGAEAEVVLTRIVAIAPGDVEQQPPVADDRHLQPRLGFPVGRQAAPGPCVEAVVTAQEPPAPVAGAERRAAAGGQGANLGVDAVPGDERDAAPLHRAQHALKGVRVRLGEALLLLLLALVAQAPRRGSPGRRPLRVRPSRAEWSPAESDGRGA